MHVGYSGKKGSETLYVTLSYTKNGKTTSKPYRKLGNVIELQERLHTDYDGVLAWAKEECAKDTDAYNKENEKVILSLSPTQLIKKDEKRSVNCGSLFLNCLFRDLRLDNVVRNIDARHSYEFNLSAILSDLVAARVIEPGSKRSSYRTAQQFPEPPKYDLHQVYRALSILADESDYIQSEVYKNSNYIHARNSKILYYDCTNYYFEIEQESGDRKYGKSKENRPNPIVGMGLFMDTDGIPLAFDLHPGSRNEQLTLKPLEQKVIRDFGCSEFIYCSDSGLGSEDNKLFNDMGGRSFVITQSLKKLKAEDRATALDPSQYRRIGSKQFIDLSELDETDPKVKSTIYYKEVPLETKKLSQTMLVTYSPKYKAYQQKVRQAQIERAKAMIGDGSGKSSKRTRNPNDPARFMKKTAVTADGEAAEKEFYELDQEAIDREAMYDGFYAVVTDMDIDPAEIIKINQRRWQIEECFRIMKTDFKARPVYLSRDDRIKAHFLICFLALLEYRLLETKLGKKYTVEEITDTLRKMSLCEIDEQGYIPTYTRTQLTDDLHELYGFRTDTQIIRKNKFRSIIKQTKKR
jgi:transposase